MRDDCIILQGNAHLPPAQLVELQAVRGRHRVGRLFLAAVGAFQFGAFFDEIEASFERVASGHYARLERRDGAVQDATSGCPFYLFIRCVAIDLSRPRASVSPS